MDKRDFDKFLKRRRKTPNLFDAIDMKRVEEIMTKCYHNESCDCKECRNGDHKSRQT